MSVDTLAHELGEVLALPESEMIRQGLLALIEEETRLAEQEIATICERYDVSSKEALLEAIQDGKVVRHPAWEDYIIWKNKNAHIGRLRQMADKL